MFSKRLIGLIFAGAMAVGSSFAAELVVKVKPPRAVVESRGRAPGRDYVWVPGFQRWDGNRYVWERGRWDRPPREHARWVAPHWQHRRDGYVFIEGRWR